MAVLLALSLLFSGAGTAFGGPHHLGYGEPYQLAGKRMVFTTWYWVRPGSIDWRDQDGQSVFTSRESGDGPFDAQFYEEDAPQGIRLVTERAKREGPVIPKDRQWDAGAEMRVSSILQENGKYRLWAKCTDDQGKRRACYLESRDGITWTKPELGLVDFRGDKRNNLIPQIPGKVFLDPIASPKERYKVFNNAEFDPKEFEAYKKRSPFSMIAIERDPGRIHSIVCYTSPDGYTWTRLAEPVSVEMGDGFHTAYYDQLLKKYVMYTRGRMIGPRATGFPLEHTSFHNFSHRRAISRSESDDFRHFPLSELVIETDNTMAPTDTYYTTCYTTIPGAPDHHLQFPMVYQQALDTSRIDMFASYDGKIWHKTPQPTVLETAAFGEWDGGVVFADPQLVERADGSWALPYTGFNYPHKYPRGTLTSDIGMAVWPRGRLMAIEAPETGFFATMAFLAPGKRVKINALTQRAGEILVEAADYYGKPLPGRTFDDAIPIIGDQYRQTIRWKNAGDVGVDPGQPIVLRFRMKYAKIYGLDFDE